MAADTPILGKIKAVTQRLETGGILPYPVTEIIIELAPLQEDEVLSALALNKRVVVTEREADDL